MVSHQGTSFAEDMGYRPRAVAGCWHLRAQARRQAILRVSDAASNPEMTSAPFGTSSIFCRAARAIGTQVHLLVRRPPERRKSDDEAHHRDTRRVAAARLGLLKEEKELTRRSDELARRRQELPWVRVDKQYRFETDEGSASRQTSSEGARSSRLPLHVRARLQAGCPFLLGNR